MPIKFKENPRTGAENKRVENGGEMHLPFALLVDTSGSMEVSVDKLNEGLRMFGELLKEDSQAVGRVEISIITYDDDARVLVPFGPAYDYEAPRVTCGGMTAMHEAVDLALREIEARKEQYKETQTPYYRPWIINMSDGAPNDTDNGAFARLKKAQEDKHCTYFSVAIGESANIPLLKSLSIQNKVLKVDREDLKSVFVWLSNSLSKTSNSNPGDKVPLPDPRDYQIEIEA